MSDLEKWPRQTDGEIFIEGEVEDDTKFFVYCVDCKKPLYYATRDNPITQRVAEETMYRHARSYRSIHRVIVVLNKEDSSKILSQPKSQ